MNIAEKLAIMFPEADPTKDFFLENRNGVSTLVWNLPEPQPTEAEIDVAIIPALSEITKKQIDADGVKKISALISGGLVGEELIRHELKMLMRAVVIIATQPQDQWTALLGNLLGAANGIQAIVDASMLMQETPEDYQGETDARWPI